MEIIFIFIGIVALYFAMLSLKLVKILRSLYIENKSLKDLSSQENKGASLEKTNVPVDHSLAKRVADEIVRLQINLAKMDESVKGYKQIKASVRKLEQSLNSNYYELEELLNKPYNNGMNVQVSFVEDENLDEGTAVITRIIKPQINYQGKLIQVAQVEVSQGF